MKKRAIALLAVLTVLLTLCGMYKENRRREAGF